LIISGGNILPLDIRKCKGANRNSNYGLKEKGNPYIEKKHLAKAGVAKFPCIDRRGLSQKYFGKRSKI